VELSERIKKEIGYYNEKIKEYQEGNADLNIKGIRSLMGVYAEREKEKYMTRIKSPAGKITISQLQAVGEIADRYSNGRIHFTTRQDIQFQGVELQNTVKIMDEALTLGIDTYGAGGNSARNVACSPLSGAAKDEVFDVTPYALAAAGHFLSDESITKLPRKYKVSFSNNDMDTAYATISDLGFVAKIRDGKRGFELYGAGGLGGVPTKALKLEEFVEAKDALYYVQAMKELFDAEGDRQNRAKARIRFIAYRLGEEKFKELFDSYVEKVRKEINLDLDINTEDKKYEAEASSPAAASPILSEQKQKGYYSVYVHTENGYLETENLYQILNYLKALDYEASIRLTNTQGFYIRDIKGKDADALLKIISGFTTDPLINNIVNCVGVTVCGIGLCNSQGLARAIYRKISSAPESVRKALPAIHISGCPNSCGQHQIGKIGLSGKGVKGREGMIPSYRVQLGGVIGVDKTKLGEIIGEIPARKVPEFLYRLSVLIVESTYSDFDVFAVTELDKIEKLVKEFEVSDDDTQLYFDFESDVRFLSKS
jgi:sulfite reductase (ferredoxin)